MAMSKVNLTCARIHDMIQNSGLHFVINQTPWSSYITIRRKFASNDIASDENLETSDVINELKSLKDKNKNLEQKLTDVEIEKVELEEEFIVSNRKYEKTVDQFHSRIAEIENTHEEMMINLNKAESKIVNLEKEKETKNEIIRNINAHFNAKIAELHNKMEELESFERERVRKEKKSLKKQRQRTEKESSRNGIKSDAGIGVDMNANDLCDAPKVPDFKYLHTECSTPVLELSPARQSLQASTPPSPHTPTGLPPARVPSFTSPAHPPKLPSSLSQGSPCSTSTPPDITTYSKNEPKASLDMKEVMTDSKISVQSKLQEAIDSGVELKFENLVELIKNHPWEECMESSGGHDEYNCSNEYYTYDSFTDNEEGAEDEQELMEMKLENCALNS